MYTTRVRDNRNTTNPQGVGQTVTRIPVDFSDSEASEFAKELTTGLSSVLGVPIPDMTTVGLPKVEIGKKTTFDMNPILSVALSGLDQKVADDEVVAADEAARQARVASNDDPSEVNSERPGADARKWMASVMSPDARSSVFAGRYVRRLKATSFAKDDDFVGRLAQKRVAEINRTFSETADFETAERMLREFLDDRVVYVDANGVITPAVMSSKVYESYVDGLNRGRKVPLGSGDVDRINFDNASTYFMQRRISEDAAKYAARNPAE